MASDLSYITGQSTVNQKRVITRQRMNGIDVLRVYTYPSLHRSFAWRIVSFLSFMITSIAAGLSAGRADIVIGTSPPIFQAVSAWVLSVIRQSVFLLEIRDLWPEFAIDIGVLRNPMLIWLSRRLELFLYRRADHLLVNSPAYRDYLISKAEPPTKITLIANGVDPDKFDPEASGAEFKRKWNLKGEYVVTYAGAMGMANDLETLLRAAHRLKAERHVRFMIVGDGKDRPALEALASELDLKNVTFTGPVPKEEMAHVLAASDACVALLKPIPMFRTTYPNKVFDYMAAGRPIILAIDGVIREVVEAANAGVFVPPGNPDLLARAVARLSADRGAGARMGSAARSYVVANFNRNQQAAEFVQLLHRLAEGTEQSSRAARVAGSGHP